MIVAGGVLAAQAAFAYYFVPISKQEYLQFETYFPVATVVGLIAWTVLARAMTSDLRRYLAVSRGEKRVDATAGGVDLSPRAGAAVSARAADGRRVVGDRDRRRADRAPASRLRSRRHDRDLATATLVLALAGAIYEQLWHRDVLRPLLAHLTQRYRVPVRSIAPSLSLRSKLMLSFGGVVLLACGMALLWGFVQYKNLSTESAQNQSDIGLRWLRSEVQPSSARSASTDETRRRALRASSAKEPGRDGRHLLRRASRRAAHRRRTDGRAEAALVRALADRATSAPIALDAAELTGKAGRLA